MVTNTQPIPAAAEPLNRSDCEKSCVPIAHHEERIATSEKALIRHEGLFDKVFGFQRTLLWWIIGAAVGIIGTEFALLIKLGELIISMQRLKP